MHFSATGQEAYTVSERVCWVCRHTAVALWSGLLEACSCASWCHRKQEEEEETQVDPDLLNVDYKAVNDDSKTMVVEHLDDGYAVQSYWVHRNPC